MRRRSHIFAWRSEPSLSPQTGWKHAGRSGTGSPELTACAPGDDVTIYTTALTTSPAGIAAPAQPLLTKCSGNELAEHCRTRFVGLVSPGLYQINAIVPALGSGDQELVITSGGVKSPSGVVLFVRR